MKQVMLLFLCVVAVLLLGSAMQRGDLNFGPVATVETPASITEDPQPDSSPHNGVEPRQAGAEALRFGSEQQP